MLLTKDNLVKFVREKKYVTPTTIAESFETTTMIGSAALSELAQAKIVAITNIKLGSSPYYYDPLQKQCLIELGDKHLSGHEKEVFNKLKQFEIVNDNSLTIQEKIAMEKIKDFTKPLEVQHQDRNFKFWVWYLRDLNETKKLIIEALNPKNVPASKEEVAPKKEKIISKPISTSPINNFNSKRSEAVSKEMGDGRREMGEKRELENGTIGDKEIIEEEEIEVEQIKQPIVSQVPKREFKPMNGGENQVEHFIEKYLFENNLKIENKNKTEKGILYSTLLKGTNLQIHIDCFYFTKKPTEGDLIFFYTSSMKPKIVFIENAPPKLFKLVENIQNMTLVNI